MLITKNIHENAKYFLSFMTAYNVDAEALQSMISTAAKVVTLQQRIQHNDNPTELRAIAHSISRVWFEHTKSHPLFAEYHNAFEYVERHVDSLLLRFHTQTMHHPYDTLVRYVTIADPTASGLEVLDLESGERTSASAIFQNNREVAMCQARINNQDVIVWNATRAATYH